MIGGVVGFVAVSILMAVFKVTSSLSPAGRKRGEKRFRVSGFGFLVSGWVSGLVRCWVNDGGIGQ
jgi:hypothetical protein